MGLLRLTVQELRDRRHWRWLLTDADGTPLADHQVAVDEQSFEFAGFTDLQRFLRRHAHPDQRSRSEAALVRQVGAWIGRELLGGVMAALLAEAPVTVEVVVPHGADWLMFRPWELAETEGATLAESEVTLVFVPAAGSDASKEEIGRALRMLAIFSMPLGESLLALRRERYELARLVRRLAGRGPRAIELRVLQYGVTRDRLRREARDGEGWDIFHVSGHGLADGLVLEHETGEPDVVDADELVGLLRPARRRLKLAVLSSCQSAAATAAETLRWMRLDEPAAEFDEAATEEVAGELTGVPNLGRRVMEELDCAVVAMRFSVADAFATRFADELYELLLDSGQPLDVAIRNAIPTAAQAPSNSGLPAISIGTPALFGRRAVGLALRPPAGVPTGLSASGVRMVGFPREPERFVGRTGPMAAATAALAVQSGRTGVLFHGMAGAGKTSCARELAYRHETAFAAHAYWEAPESHEEALAALPKLAHALEATLGPQLDGGLPMVDAISNDAALDRFLPRFTRLLEITGIMLVLDNLETLLTGDGEWRDPRWRRLIDAMLGHDGESRVVMTSRVVPAGLSLEAVCLLPVHALSLAETALLARELPNLGGLMDGGAPPERRTLVRRTLAVVQGHPKLLELADSSAADLAELEQRVSAAEASARAQNRPLDAFFEAGHSAFGPERFMRVLAEWTESTASALDEGALLLVQMISCMEEHDRVRFVLHSNWEDLWRSLRRGDDCPELDPLLEQLAGRALIEPGDSDDVASTLYRMHPGVAEAVRAITGEAIATAVDKELAEYWTMIVTRATEDEEVRGVGQAIVAAGLNAAPYLIRREQWQRAGTILAAVMGRAESPQMARRLLPYVRRVADELEDARGASLLGRALVPLDVVEAERHLREAIALGRDSDDHETGSVAYGHLINLLRQTGRFSEALEACDAMEAFTVRSSAGPWTQLSDACQRLQVRAEMGQHEEVLDELVKMRARADELPERSENEMLHPWNVRETLLDIGCYSALSLNQWERVLELSDEILEIKRRRGASEHDIAATTINRAAPLQELKRYDECERMLDACQAVMEAAEDPAGLAHVFASRGSLERSRGNAGPAVALMRTALRLDYVDPDVANIAIGHTNLALSLAASGGEDEEIAANWAAAFLLTELAGIAHMRSGIASELRAWAGALPSSLPELFRHVTAGHEGIRLDAVLQALGTTEEMHDELIARMFARAREAGLATNISGFVQPLIAATLAASTADEDVRAAFASDLQPLADSEDWSALAAVLRRIVDGERGADLLDGLDEIDTAVASRVLSELGVAVEPPRRPSNV